jgi:regulator of RNase E activity RraA
VGVVVNAGDVILCGESAVLVIPPEETEAESRRTLKTQENEVDFQPGTVGGEKLWARFGARSCVDGALSE